MIWLAPVAALALIVALGAGGSSEPDDGDGNGGNGEGGGEGEEPDLDPEEIEPAPDPDWRTFNAEALTPYACSLVNALPDDLPPPSAPVLSLDLLRSLFPSTSWPGAMGSETYAFHTAVVSQLLNRILSGEVICDAQIIVSPDAQGADFYQIKKGDTLLGASGIIARRYPHLSSGERVGAARRIIADPLNRGILAKTQNEGNKHLLGDEMISFYPRHFANPTTILARFLAGSSYAAVHFPADL